ncbi:primase-helicase family protein [Cupriavidus necator]|uniref:NrS-1 polymerase-like helicase domain-containing protein n=1 Tax=Cupriavidus pinatubonensis (strain JMP 134 / LMG 1197) TaxID=264198 RepID=Q46W12_CUPPJ|nr:primase-helicase family protein [Cupriavidus necator]
MSAQIIQLHTEAPAASVAQSPRKPTKAEKAIIADYVQDLIRRGFCKITDKSAKETRLFNRFDGEPQTLSYLRENFTEWLDDNGKECEFFCERYFIRRLKHIVGRVFKPNAPEFTQSPITGYRYANTYRRYEPTVDSADLPSCFHAYFERMFPAKHQRHIVLQWLAHIFRRPDQRPSWHLMLLSEPGTGKGFLVQNILQPLLHHTSVVASYSRITGKHSAVLVENLVILLDDCKSRSEATQTEMKSFLSEERALVERKYASAGMEDTYARMILASNEEIPLYVDPNERRWYIPDDVVHLVDLRETQANIIQPLADWLDEPGSLCKVYNWFMQYPLDGFNHKSVPESEGLTRLIDKSKGPYRQYIEDYVKDNKVFTYADLVESMTDAKLSKPSDRELGHVLREIGYEATQRRIDGVRLRLCHPVGMSLQDIRAAYSASPTDPNTPF